MGEKALALADFDRAIERDPRLAAAYLQRGKIRTESGDFDAALADFGQLMTLRANDPETYLNRGICLVKKGLVARRRRRFPPRAQADQPFRFCRAGQEYLRECESSAARSLPAAGANGSPPARPPQNRPLPSS